MARLQLEIVTPDRVVLRTGADYVSLPGVEGEFGILPGHIPFFAVLSIGRMHYEADGKTVYACLSGGFAEVADNTVHLLVDSSELVPEINVTRAEAAKKRAEERLREAAGHKGDIDVFRAETALRKSIARLQTAGRPGI
jgi:F-type H+-transporting ATPase subunit epsilon